MGRPKDSETFCKLADGCTLAKKHEPPCSIATSANERSARYNCGGPHEYQAALERIRKANNDPLNEKKDPSGLRAAGAALAEGEKAAKKGGKKGQAKLPLGSPTDDIRRVSVTHEVARPMSPDAFRTTAAQAAREHNKIKAIEKEIHDFSNAAQIGPGGEERPSRKKEIGQLKGSVAKLDREIEAEAHLVETPCIELHNPSTWTVSVYTDDNGEPGEKVKERKMTQEEYDKALEDVPFEPAMDPPPDDAPDPAMN